MKIGLYFKNSNLFLKTLLAFWDTDFSIILLDNQLSRDELLKRTNKINLHFLVSDTNLEIEENTYTLHPEVYLQCFHAEIDNLLEQTVPHGSIILFTSGSQNEPKPVVLKKESILNNVRKVKDYTQLSAKDCALITLPLSYSYALSQSLAHLLVGARINFTAQGFLVANICTLINQERITNFAATPYFYRSLVSVFQSNSQFASSLQSVRFLMNAGGFLQPEIIQKICNYLPHVTFYNNYGQTEASPRLAYAPFNFQSESFDGIGKPLPGVKLYVDALDPSGIGNIIYQSEDFMLGYYPHLSAEGISRIHKTGDIGYQKNNGEIVIVGRDDSMIKINGRKTYTSDIEQQIIAVDGVNDVKVRKEHHDIYGEYLKAIIVPKAGVKTTELQQIIKKTLDKSVTPRLMEFVDEFHLNSNGKVCVRS